jgi:putative tricarboxylic transport membrane protein
MILAFVLGPILERAIRQALLISAGSPLIFFTRPISGTLMGFLILFIVAQAFWAMRKKKANHTQ